MQCRNSSKFKGSCLKQIITSFIHANVMNLFTVYELNNWARDLNIVFTLSGYHVNIITKDLVM